MRNAGYSPDMFGIGGWEMILIMVVALLVFGPKRLPELARSLGRGLAEFRRASSDLRKSMDLDLDPNHPSTPDPETLPPAQAGSPASPPAPDSSPTASGAGTEADDPRERNAASSPAVKPTGSAASAGEESPGQSGD